MAQLLYLLLTVLGDTYLSPLGKPLEVFMRPIKRYGVNKRSSARQFRGDVSHTKAQNLRPPPMRGGFRL